MPALHRRPALRSALRRLAWSGVLALLAARAAHADVYEFVDDQGVVHFSDAPTDPRFRLVLRDADHSAIAPLPARTLPQREAPAWLLQTIERTSRRHGLDASLLRAVIQVESGYDPNARSPKGALGLMQLMPATARRYGVKDALDPVQNLRGGAAYLRDLLAMFNQDVRLALAAYNAGEQAVTRHGGRIPPYAETQRYVPAVLAVYDDLTHARR